MKRTAASKLKNSKGGRKDFPKFATFEGGYLNRACTRFSDLQCCWWPPPEWGSCQIRCIATNKGSDCVTTQNGGVAADGAAVGSFTERSVRHPK